MSLPIPNYVTAPLGVCLYRQRFATINKTYLNGCRGENHKLPSNRKRKLNTDNQPDAISHENAYNVVTVSDVPVGNLGFMSITKVYGNTVQDTRSSGTQYDSVRPIAKLLASSVYVVIDNEQMMYQPPVFNKRRLY
ncbi:hypothetical protein CBL_02843 [Carabus blaptoides fortunei]